MLREPLELTRVECPYCGALWDRREVDKDVAVHQVKCRCKRLIVYRLDESGRPEVLQH